MTLNNEVKDLYDKSPKKKIKDLRRWKYIPCLLIGRINVVKMVILLKAIYRLNVIPIKIPNQFFIELERPICKFFWNNKQSRRVKTILNNKITSGGITNPDLKLYYRAIVIKTVRYLSTCLVLPLWKSFWRFLRKIGHSSTRRSRNTTPGYIPRRCSNV
jgi:hypothetical protein